MEWRRILAYSLSYAGRVQAGRERWPEAEALAKEGLDLHEKLLEGARHLGRDHREFVQIYGVIALMSGKRSPETPADHLTLAYEYYDRKQYVSCAEHFRKALKDEAVRNDMQRSHLYNGACAASLASTVTKAEEASAWKRQAVAYVRGALTLWRRELAALEKAAKQRPERAAEFAPARDRFRQLIANARDRETDLAPLRDLPEFQALFDE